MPRYLDQAWHTMLKTLAWRDAPAEMSRRVAGEDVPPITYRGRLFEVLPDGQIVIERPSQVVRDNAFGPGDDIELLLMQNHERLVATCTIREAFIRQINAGVRVTCFRLSPGRRPQREQRRAFYRVGIAALALEPVVLIDPDAEQPEPVQGKLVNLSGGGLGVSLRAARKTLNQVKRTPRFVCTANFGGETGALTLPVTVAHVSPLGDDGLYLGLRFDIQDEQEARANEDLMVQLCAEFQRMQLQRRRA